MGRGQILPPKIPSLDAVASWSGGGRGRDGERKKGPTMKPKGRGEYGEPGPQPQQPQREWESAGRSA
jgi:hypothetical protein